MSEQHNIKVLMVNTNECYGGAAIAANRIHKAVNAAECGVSTTMLVKNRQTNDASVISVDKFIPPNCAFRVVDYIARKLKNKRQHLRWSPYRNTQNRMYKSDTRGMYIGGALKKLDYDVLHLNWINERFLRLSDISNEKPIIWTLHDSWEFCGVCHCFLDCDRYKHQCGCCPQLGSGKFNDLSHKVWKEKQKCYADKDIHIVCPTQWLADCAAKSELLRDRDIRVIPNSLDTDLFRPIENAEQSDIPIVLYGAVNALNDPNKGLSKLLAALRILDEKNIPLKLVVFGDDGKDLLLDLKNISVNYKGYVCDPIDLVNLYNKATVTVVPSLFETFGQVASESMACGTPVVAFRCTGIQDVVSKDGGYLAEPYSVEDLARGIEWIVNHNRNNEMRELVRNSAVERFSTQVVMKQYIDLYKEVTTRGI